MEREHFAFDISEKSEFARSSSEIGVATQEKMAREQGIDLNLEREVTLSAAEGDFLTGKNAFPEYLRALVEEKIAP